MSFQNFLLNPGPVTLSKRVRAALQKPDLCHREPEFEKMLQRIGLGLKSVDPAVKDSVPLVLAGSGTTAVEAMLQSFVPRNGQVLVLVNGVYGERMVAMLAAQGKRARVLASDWGQELPLHTIKQNLSDIDAIAIVHHETTTGRLNPLTAVAELAAETQIPLLVDAVSSFGAEALPQVPGLMAAFAATANKCLHGVPGASFVLADPRLLKRPSGASSLVLDLCRYQDASLGLPVPFTPAVHALYALEEALQEFQEQGGLEGRYRLYQARSQLIREGLRTLGFQPLLADQDSSICLSAFLLPSGISYQALHDDVKKHGFIVYAGQGGLAGEILRVAFLGDLPLEALQRFLSHVQSHLRGRL